jgi:type II secretory pathway component GspD/PulD (secretin)
VRKKAAYVTLIVFFILTSTTPLAADGRTMRIFKIQHASAESLRPVVESLKSPEGTLSFDRNTNSLIVVDYPVNLQRIADVIESLDVQQKNVRITVVVSDVTQNFLDTIGLHSGQLIIPGPEISAVLGLLKKDTRSSIRSEMSLTTLSNHPARLQVTKEEIFGHSLVRYRSRHHDTTVISVIKQPVGNFLEVLPQANNDGTITITLQPAVSTLQNGLPYERTVLTRITINNGDTLVIGGLDSGTTQTSSTTSVFGVPVAKTTAGESKKVVMFLTATIAD